MDRSRWNMLFRQVAVVGAVLVACVGLWAQGGGGQGRGGGKGGPKGPPPTPKSQAPIDLTGYWVSIVTEDWLYRMVTPAKGDVASIPVSAAGRAGAAAWDPDKDAAAGNACLAYGPPGLTRMPGRLHIEWADDNTLKMDDDAGTQTRLLKFGAAAAGPASRMGNSVATWDGLGRGGRGGGGTFGVPAGLTGDANAGKAVATPIRPGALRVITTNMTPGYLRKNGVPYSAQTTLSEWWDIVHEPNGDQYLVISSVIEDPVNLTQPWRTSTHFKKEPNGSKYAPSACSAK
jgi:hypothetical protein